MHRDLRQGQLPDARASLHERDHLSLLRNAGGRMSIHQRATVTCPIIVTFFGLTALAVAQPRPLDNIASRQYPSSGHTDKQTDKTETSKDLRTHHGYLLPRKPGFIGPTVKHGTGSAFAVNAPRRAAIDGQNRVIL